MTTTTFTGNLADDPKLSYTPSGAAVLELKVLENRSSRTSDGQWIDDIPNSFRVKAWRSLAENAAESLTKGLTITVTAKMITEKFRDKKTDQWVYTTYWLAKDVAVSLRYHTATVTKSSRKAAETGDTDESDANPDAE